MSLAPPSRRKLNGAEYARRSVFCSHSRKPTVPRQSEDASLLAVQPGRCAAPLPGMDAAILRTAMGSSVQLPAYNLAKTSLQGWGVGDHIGLYLLASTFSGGCVCAVMQPAGKPGSVLFLRDRD